MVAFLSLLSLISFILRLLCVPGTTKIPLIRCKDHLRPYQGSLASPEGCQRAVCVEVDLAHCVYWHSSLCWITVPAPTARKGKGLFSLGVINAIWRLQSTGVQIVLREGHRSLCEMSKQEGVTVVSNTVRRLICSIIQHNSLSLSFNLPSRKGSLIPLPWEEKQKFSVGWDDDTSRHVSSWFTCLSVGITFSREACSPLPSVCLQICCPFRDGSHKSRLEVM